MGASTDTMAMASLDEVTAAEWQALAQRRVFFGHQSVGRNMMEGIRAVLAQRPDIGLKLVQTSDPSSVEGPALFDANIGENRRPASKADAFVRVVEAGLGKGALAMYKYCYIDVAGGTDIDALFEAYREQTRRLERAQPGVTLVHVTMPLKTAPEGLKETVKTMLGRPTETALNIKRNRFNELMRTEYGSRAPVFDLARLESSRPDGSRAFTRYQGRPVDMLAPEWTYDNGHLNEAGRRHVAEQFLVMLARLAAAPVGAPASAGAAAAPAQSD